MVRKGDLELFIGIDFSGELDQLVPGGFGDFGEAGNTRKVIFLAHLGLIAGEATQVALLGAQQMEKGGCDGAVCTGGRELKLLRRQSRTDAKDVEVGPTVVAKGLGTDRRQHQPILSLVSCQGMALDTLQARGKQLALYERYSALLTDHQRRVLDLYLRNDWSLAEIAQHEGTSRAAVHDIVRRSTHALQDYEKRLGLLAEAQRRRRTIEALEKEVAALQRRMARLSI